MEPQINLIDLPLQTHGGYAIMCGMETTQTDQTLPVVIVGKDRTRMTCAVIDHIKAHIKNAQPYFICVSDRSRPGHDRAIENHLKEIGETEYAVLRTMPEENRYGWGAAINIGLECAFDVCKECESVLVVDNDWLLQRDLDYDKYLYAFAFSDIGAITFKPVHAGTNIAVREISLSDGSRYLLRSPAPANGRYSFTAELGCVLLAKRMKEEFGRFKENCRTDETEWGFCNWYNALLDEQRISKHVWYATDMEMYYTGLNGKDHVFTHVGLVSQHEGPHKWECPDVYKYLSDDAEDEKVCKEALWEERKEMVAMLTPPKSDEPVKIDWAKYFDKVYCTFLLRNENPRLPRLLRELKRVDLLDSPVFEWRYDVETKLDEPLRKSEGWKFKEEGYKKHCYNYIRTIKEASLLGFSRVMVIEDDIAFLKDKKEIIRVLETLPNVPIVQMDKFVWHPHKEQLVKESQAQGLHYIKEFLTAATCNIYNKEGMRLFVQTLEENKCNNDWVGKYAKDGDVLVAVRSLAIQIIYGKCINSLGNTIEALHNCYRRQGIDENYSEYSVPEGYNMHSIYCEKEDISAVALPNKGRTIFPVAPQVQNQDIPVSAETIEDIHPEMHINRRCLIDMLQSLGKTNIRMLEIGSAMGDSAEVFLLSGLVSSITCVDPWKDNPRYMLSHMDRMESDFDARMSRFGEKCRKFKGTFRDFIQSEEAKETTYDLVYIDAIHEYEDIRRDIIDTLTQICPTVAIAGHDYGMPYEKWNGVKKAVDEIFQKDVHIFGDSSWCHILTDKEKKIYYSNNEKINILYCVDSNENALHMMEHSIRSVKDTLGEDNVRIFVATSAPYKRSGITVIDANPYIEKYGLRRISQKRHYIWGNFPEMIAFRNLAPWIHELSFLDKILYLDNDTELIGTKILEVMKKDMTADIKAVFEHDNYCRTITDKILSDKTLLDNMSVETKKRLQNGDYFNAGIMVMNLEKMRKSHPDKGIWMSHMIELMCQWSSESIDQDIINVLYDAAPLDESFNMMPDPKVGCLITPGAPEIIHYAGPSKYGISEYPPSGLRKICFSSRRAQKKGRKFVSVYAIAKNEASVAKRWYECVKEADEVCVLDTGSTDDTVKILRELGAYVEVKTYADWSFAVARNDSMNLVSPESEILFTLDMDETIAPGWRKLLEDAWIAEEEKGRAPAGVLYKYIWSWLPDGKEAQSFSVRKIHAHGVGKWKYRCHELLIDVKGPTFFLDGFVVEHHQNKQTNRASYLALLEKDAKEMPDDDRSAYYYARELMYNERWEEAKEEFKRHLSLPSAGWRAERASSMRNIAKCYENLKNEDMRELWLWKAAEEDPTNREATYQLGVMALDRKDYRTAVKVLQRCIEIEHPSLEYISEPIVWSPYPWMFYSQALWWVNRWDDAINACRKALEMDPENGQIKAQMEGMIATRDKVQKESK